MSDVHRIGSRIRAAREAAGLTPEQMATAMGATKKQLEAFETGDRYPSAKRLITIAQLCNVPLSYFADRGE